MATITKGKTFTNGELVTPASIHQLVDSATISGIVNADIHAQAAIADSKLAQITTVGKVTAAAVAGTAVITTDARLSDARTPTAHTHTIANVTDLQTTLDGKQASGSYAPATGIAPSAITGTAVITTDARLSDARTPTAHTHTIANVTDLQTTLDGKQASGSYAPATGIAPSAITGTAVITTDARLSDARTPASHTHGNISNAGAIGTTATLPVITGASGLLQAGSFGTTAGTFCQGSDSRLSDARTPASHTHGNISNTGAIGTTATLPVITGASGVLQAGSFGTTAGTFCQGSDSRLSDARTPTTHTHGNITNAGAIGTTATLPVITGTSGVLQAGSFGTTAGTFCQGSDSRLSDARTPTAHTHDAGNITGRFQTFQFGYLNEPGPGGFETTGAIGTTIVSDAGRNSVVGAILARFQRTNTSGETSIIGTITAAGSGTGTTPVSGVAYNTTSDYRLKTNLEPLSDAVARLLQIPVHRFNWLGDPDGVKVDGFLAHEAQAIVPESVTGHKDEVDAEGKPVHQGIDQSKLVPLLVAAVQELAARVAALEAR